MQKDLKIDLQQNEPWSNLSGGKAENIFLKDHSAQAKYVRSVTLNEKLDWTAREK